MKFSALITSTILVILISQHSTLGLPVSETDVGYSHDDEMTTSMPSTRAIPEKKQSNSDSNICSKGMESNEDGICQPVELSRNQETVNQKANSCPENYIKFKGSCLYIKPKQQTAKYPGNSIADTSNPVKSRLGNNETVIVENIPVLSDNSCPKGTEYSEHGVCQKRTSSPVIRPKMAANGLCSDNSQLVEGKCIGMKFKIADEDQSSTTIKPPKETWKDIHHATEPVNHDDKTESVPISEIDIEVTTMAEQDMRSYAETTSQSVSDH